MTEHAGEQGDGNRARLDEPRQVERLALAEVDPAGLVAGVHGEGDEARGHEDEHEARRLEEPGQVES